VGTLRPAWVATYEISPQEILDTPPIRVIVGLFGYQPELPPPPRLVVAYRAQAFLDAAGDLHIDARQAVIAGPQADAWSPDSFVIRADGTLATEDDNGNGNAGIIERRISPPDDGYRRLLTDAQVAVGGGI
jgi:hypothetical protein